MNLGSMLPLSLDPGFLKPWKILENYRRCLRPEPLAEPGYNTEAKTLCAQSSTLNLNPNPYTLTPLPPTPSSPKP